MGRAGLAIVTEEEATSAAESNNVWVERVRELCALHHLGEVVEKEAVGRLEAVLEAGLDPALSGEYERDLDKDRVWAAAVLYVTLALQHVAEQSQRRKKRGADETEKEDKKEEGNTLTLNELSQALQVTVSDIVDNVRVALEASVDHFLQHEAGTVPSPRNLRRSARNARSPSSVEGNDSFLLPSERQVLQQLESLKLNHARASTLFRKFRNSWDTAGNFLPFSVPLHSKQTNAHIFHTAWLLFILVRQEDQAAEDIVRSYKFLVAVIYLTRFARMETTQLQTLSESQGVGAKRKGMPCEELEQRPAKMAKQVFGKRSTRGSGKVQITDEIKFFEFFKVAQDEVMRKVAVVKDMLQGILHIFPEQCRDVMFLLSAGGLSSLQVQQALSDHYRSTYVKSIVDFDQRSFLQESPFVQSTSTPLRPISYNTSHLLMASYQHNKAKHQDISAPTPLEQPDGNCDSVRVTKNLFDTPSSSSSTSTSSSEYVQDKHNTSNSATTAPISPTHHSAAKLPPLHSGLPVSVSSTSAHSSSSSLIKVYNSPMRPSKLMNNNGTPGLNTPVSLAIEASNWLGRELEGAPDAPSETLLRFFRECDANPYDAVSGRMKEMCEALREEYVKTRSTIAKGLFQTDQTETATRPERSNIVGETAGVDKSLNLGSRLYFRVLESIVRGESSRLGVQKFDVLLHNDMFHRSLFACCMEVVFRSKEVFRMMYPVLTSTLCIPVFELVKVLESFRNYVPMLPRLLKQHLQLVEVDILEEACWVSGSQVYALLAEKKKFSQEKKQLELLQQEQDKEDLEMRSKRLAPLELFLKKLLPLAHEKMKGLYSKLGLSNASSSSNYNDMWNVFRSAILHHPELLLNRRVDHVILCTIYGVCKVKRVTPEISFKKLLSVYKKSIRNDQKDMYAQLVSKVKWGIHHSTKYDRLVHEIDLSVEDSSETVPSQPARGDLVAYYNQVYIPRMKETILNLRTKVTTQPPAKASSSSSSADSSATNASTARAATVTSPERKLPRHLGMTPRTLELYAFQESPQPSNVVNTRSTRSRLRRNPMEDDGATTPSIRSSRRLRIQNLAERQRQARSNAPSSSTASSDSTASNSIAAAPLSPATSPTSGRRRVRTR